ncbi:MAG: ABC transporter permease [Acidobacteria bacterium]|nr:ABC transporter permease [Acidobacteriota bacterium]
MSDSTNTTRAHFCLWLIRFVGLIVPERLRADWRQEWEAEIRTREILLAEWDKLERKHKFDLLRRSLGAFWDAVWLQPQRWEDEMSQDIRFGLRMVLRRPGFTGLVLLTLMLGIGTTITIFSVVNSIMLRPLPYRDADRLVKVLESMPQKKLERNYLSLGDFQAWREQCQSFEEMAALMHTGFRVTGSNEPENVSGNQVSANLFAMLGVKAVLGRTFLPTDESPKSDSVVILSQTRLGADAEVIGKTLTLNAQVHTIIGVLPAEFREAFESFPGRAQLWTPVVWTDRARAQHGTGGNMMLARLRREVTLTQARAEMMAVAERLAQTYPQSNVGVSANVFLLHEEVTRNTREMLWIFMSAALFVLLIACTNIAGLMLTRGLEREREMAIRGALGAGRWRMLRQVLTENFLLSLLGGAGGMLFASWLLRLMIPLLPRDLPRANEIRLDARALWMALLAAAFSALFFGLLPALQAMRIKLTEVLKSAGRNASANRRQRYWRNGFVIAQIALTLVLLLGAGLLTRSLQQLYRVDPGFQTENLLTMFVNLPRANNEVPQQWNLFWNSLLERARGLSEVQQVAAVMPLPLSDSMFLTRVRLTSGANLDEDLPVGNFYVSDGFFATMGMRILSGRALDTKDQANTATVVVVNETFARNFFPNQPAVGQTIIVDSNQKEAKPAVIVGVTSDARIRLTEPVRPQIYKSIQQFPSPALYLVARTEQSPQAMNTTLRGLVYGLNKNQPVSELRTMESIWAEYTVAPRFYLTLLGGFALLALLLALTGIYGVLSYTAAQRTQEIGIRLALGAQQSDVLKMIVRQGMTLVLTGLVIGLIAAHYLTQLMKGLLFGIGTRDPFTFIFVPLVLIMTTLIACYLPARRAMQVDPMVALRHE